MKNLKRITAVLVIIISIFAAENAAAKILMKPYLQAVTDSSVVVMIESDTEDDAFVFIRDLGTNSNVLFRTSFIIETTASPKTYVHRVKVTELKPNKLYAYAAVQDGDSSDAASFRTAPAGFSKFRFAVMGDCRSNPKVLDKISKNMEAYKPNFAVYTGDLCYDAKYSSWKEEFFTDAHQDFIAKVPFFNSVGNHEDWAQNTEAFTQSPTSGNSNKQYYSFDYGNIHFLILSTETGVGKGGSQWKFAEHDLKNSDKPFKIAVFHIPAYSGGGHGENENMKAFTKGVLEPNGVDIVFNGHSHFYQHNLVNGIHHFITAGGGAPLYSPKKQSYTLKSARKHHFVIIDAFKNKLKLTVYDKNNEVIEEVEIEKD